MAPPGSWIVCPECGLKHTLRPDGYCPKCRTIVEPGASAPVGGPPPYQPPSTALPPPSPAPASAPPAKFSLSYDPYANNPAMRPPVVNDGPGALAWLLAVVLGAGASAACMFVWIIVAAKTGYQFGLLASGFGVAIAAAMLPTGVRGFWAVLIAGLLLVGGLTGSRIVGFEYEARSEHSIKPMVGSEEGMFIPVLYDMSRTGEVPAELGERLVSTNFLAMDDESELDPQLIAALQTYGEAAMRRVATLGDEERVRVARAFLVAICEQMTWGERLAASRSGFLYLWMILGILAARRLLKE